MRWPTAASSSTLTSSFHSKPSGPIRFGFRAVTRRRTHFVFREADDVGAPETGAITGELESRRREKLAGLSGCAACLWSALIMSETDVSIGVTAVSNGQSGTGLLT